MKTMTSMVLVAVFLKYLRRLCLGLNCYLKPFFHSLCTFVENFFRRFALYFSCDFFFFIFSIHKMFAFKQSQITLIWSLVIFTQCCEIPTFVRMLKKLLRRVLDTAEWGFNVITCRESTLTDVLALSSNYRINRTAFAYGVFILFGCPTIAEAACFVWRRTH